MTAPIYHNIKWRETDAGYDSAPVRGLHWLQDRKSRGIRLHVRLTRDGEELDVTILETLTGSRATAAATQIQLYIDKGSDELLTTADLLAQAIGRHVVTVLSDHMDNVLNDAPLDQYVDSDVEHFRAAIANLTDPNYASTTVDEEQVARLIKERDAARIDAKAAQSELAILRAKANLIGWVIFQSQQPDTPGYSKFDHLAGPEDGLQVYIAASTGRSKVRNAARCVWNLLGSGEQPLPFPGAVDYETLSDPARSAELLGLFLSNDPTPR